MIETDSRFQEFYKTNEYKGFHKLRQREYKLMGQTKITFSNGHKEIFATGIFKEVALQRIFDKIDKYVQLNSIG